MAAERTDLPDAHSVAVGKLARAKAIIAAHSETDEATGCVNWCGPLNRGGYPERSLPGFSTPAVHRVAYILAKGPIPPDHHIDHLCRNRRCINPDHLEPVTPLENVRRAWAANGPSVSAETVRAVRSDGGTIREIALRHGLSHTTAYEIRRGRRWADIAPEVSPAAHGPNPARGERSPLAKLTDDAVRAIRSSGETRRALARRYGVSPTTIHSIVKGQSWGHVA